jgi:hypothetical protein
MHGTPHLLVINSAINRLIHLLRICRYELACIPSFPPCHLFPGFASSLRTNMCLALCIHKRKHVFGLFALYILRSGLQQQPFRAFQTLSGAMSATSHHIPPKNWGIRMKLPWSQALPWQAIEILCIWILPVKRLGTCRSISQLYMWLWSKRGSLVGSPTSFGVENDCPSARGNPIWRYGYVWKWPRAQTTSNNIR